MARLETNPSKLPRVVKQFDVKIGNDIITIKDVLTVKPGETQKICLADNQYF